MSEPLQIHRFKNLDSTNLKAKELAKHGAKEGTIVIAETQNAGRGRDNRVWHSPKGGLYLSVLLLPKDVKRATDLSILAGVAISQAVKDCLPKSKDVTVKWPNDCLIDWKKVAGVLCEVLGQDANRLCVVGIGINVNVSERELEPFKGNPFSATSFMVENAGGAFDLENVTSVFLKKLFTLYELYKAEGFQNIKYLWEKNCRFIGKKLELREVGWREGVNPKRQSGITVGHCLGIDDNGALVLSNAKGERHHYFSGEISCFWQ